LCFFTTIPAIFGVIEKLRTSFGRYEKMEKSIKKELMDVLACPDCKASLKQSKDKKELECAKCKRKYAIREGIPILMPKR